MTRRIALVAVVVLGALGAGAAAATAHPLLLTAAPAPGAIVPGAPSRLTLAFSEKAVARGSGLTVTGPGSRRIALGALTPSANATQLAAALPQKLAPGVYRVHWLALGEDGHTVSGEFAFGVAEANGAAPLGASGLGAIGTGRGGSAGGESIPSVALRWLGILAASLLWGGVLLAGAATRRRGSSARIASRTLAIALAAAVISTIYGALQLASAGSGGGLDLSLLTSSGTGVSVLLRALVALAGTAAAVTAWRLRASGAATVSAALTGLLLLIGYGLSGHVLAQGSVPAALVLMIHTVAAGTWAGGLLALIIAVRAGELGAREGARAFAPIAVAGLAFAAVTGVITAVREVNHWYFLWWSGYGRLVIAKVAVVALAALAGGLIAWRSRSAASGREPEPRRRFRLLGLEAGLALVAIALASTLSGLAQGRGEPLPAQRGDLLPGPALASVVLGSGTAPLTLAPARPGLNTIVLTPKVAASSVTVRLACACDPRPVIAALHPAGGSFSAQIPVPSPGTWNAYVSVDGQAASVPAALAVGVADAPGAAVRNVLAVADLSGPGASRCRDYLTGLELAIGRLNGAGGVDGGHKVALLAYDDQGSPGAASAAALTQLRAAGGSPPVAFTPCGEGAAAAIDAAARAGVPTLAGDPATEAVPGPRVFRIAGDPYADGVAIAQAIGAEVLPVSARGVRTVEVVAVPDAQGRRRLKGLEAGLAALRVKPSVVQIPVGDITGAGAAQLAARLSHARLAALVLDATTAQIPALEAAFRRLPASRQSWDPAPVLASERVIGEDLIEASGGAGRIGMIQGTSTVEVDSRDGLTLSQALPALFPGERASLAGLRGYAAGLALDDGLAAGSAPASVAQRLRRPLPFTDAIAEPWRSDAPAAGVQRLGVLEPTFLSTTLIPTSQGGESYSGEYFSDGAWTRPTSQLFGPPLTSPVLPLGAL